MPGKETCAEEELRAAQKENGELRSQVMQLQAPLKLIKAV